MLVSTIPSPDSNAFEIGPITVNYYGLAIAAGALLGLWLLRRRYAAVGGDPDFADRAAVWGIVAAVLGARLGFVTTNLGAFVDRPWRILFIWEGGLVFFGGLLLASLTLIWYVRRSGLSLATFADAIAPAIPLAHAVGRWGNYFNQELYGKATGLPWGLEIAAEPTPVHPAFLYESLANLLLVGILVKLGRTGRIVHGGLIFCYLIGYGVIRFLNEQIRVDTDFRLLGLSRNAYAALFIVLLGLAGLWYRNRRTARPAAVPGVDQGGGAKAPRADTGVAGAEGDPDTDVSQ